MNSADRLVIVSNRLPVSLREAAEGGFRLRPASGGLVTALDPILKRNRGLWIGWPGFSGGTDPVPLIDEYNRTHTTTLLPVELTPEEIELYYEGFANGAIWPLFHDLLSMARFDAGEWATYDAVNERFAEAVARSRRSRDFTWVHDYHLMRVAHHLRARRVRGQLHYFHHIPFPSADLFRRLPWHHDLLKGLLDYDLLGFQALRDRRNFIATVREHYPGVQFTRKRRYTLIHMGKRTVRVGNYPISIDFGDFDRTARGEAVERETRAMRNAYPAEQLILGLDRLDYTKGIPHRFLAFERLLETHPEWRGKVSLLQVVVPSRTEVPRYIELKEELDSLTGRINGRFSDHGYIPIYYYFKHLTRTELLAHYRACSVALITPLRDGMNLVAKEYAASRIDLDGVLVLSEFTGSADQLGHGALMVNPYDLEGTAETIHHALTLPRAEREARMRSMRSQVRQNDVYRWVGWFMEARG